MTNDIKPTSAPTTAATILAADDPRTTFAKAVQTAAEAVDTVRPDQLADSTQCGDFDVRTLLGHLVAVLDRVTALGAGDDPMAMSDIATGVADDSWHSAWLSGARHAQAAWSDASLLDKTMTLPWATLPGAGMLAMYTSEITTHTWDLAQATGQSPTWDETVLEVSLASIRQSLPSAERQPFWEAFRSQMPEGMEDFEPPFGDAISVPDDAPLIDRLVAWTGRRP